MKKRILCVVLTVLVSLSWGDMVFAAKKGGKKIPAGITSAKKVKKNKIKIDGKLKEKDWTVTTNIKGKFPAANNKAKFGLLWDKDYLYVGFKVTDSKLNNAAFEVINKDHVQIYLDMNNNHLPYYDLFDSFYAIAYKTDVVWEKYNKTMGVIHASKKTKKGYNVEAAFPWETIMADKPKAGQMFGFDAGVGDNDNGSTVNSKLIWYGAADNDSFTQNFGECYLNNEKNKLKVPKHPKKKAKTYYNFKNFYEYVYPEDPFRIVRAWIPYENESVKGFIIVGNGGNGDWRYESAHRELQIFAKRYGYGVVSHKGIVGSQTYTENGKLILDALNLFADKANHLEFKNAPFIYSGSSSGGASSYGMMNYVPERVIGITSNVTASFNPEIPADGALKVPAMFTTGEFDGSYERMNTMVTAARLRGALWSWAPVQGMAHEHRRTYHMFFPFWAKCIEARVPADANPLSGPVKLNDMAEENGWLADVESRFEGNMNIAAFDDYTGEKSAASWLFDKDIAFLHRGLGTWNQKLNITMDDNPAPFEDVEYAFKILKKGDEVKLNAVFEDDSVKFKKVEFYKGAVLIGETEGTSISYKLGEEVVQTFTAIGYSEDGREYTSSILGVIVE